MNLRLKRTPGIYLVGFMGCGKTTVGRRLAERLGWHFTDLDDEIETAAKMAIADIFSSRGEGEFRRLESEVLRACVAAIERGRPTVVSLGGGAFAAPANRALTIDNGVTIWLDCPFEIVRRRVAQCAHRPLARDPERFAALFASRREFYSQAETRIAVESDDPEPVVAAILALTQLR
jgi:shikimate kinase